MLVKVAQHDNPRGNAARKNQKKDDKACEHCKMAGHIKDTCFKLNVYPDWSKQLKKDKGGCLGKSSMNMVNTLHDQDELGGKKDTPENWTPRMTEYLQQEISRILKSKQMGGEQVYFAQLEDFASNVHSNSPSLNNESSDYWVLDTSATTHICSTRNLFHTLKPLPN